MHLIGSLGRRRGRCACICAASVTIALIWLTSGDAAATHGQPVAELRYLDTRSYPTIDAYVLVHRSGLSPDSVTVTEDRQEVPATVEELAREPVAMAVVLDSSGSMAKGEKAASALTAVDLLLRVVRPFDPVGIVVFGRVPRVRVPVTTDRAGVESALEAYEPKGTTAFRDAVYVAIDQLRAVRADRKIVLALTDGLDNNSRRSSAEVVAHALRAGVAIWTVGYGNPDMRGDRGVDAASLRNLAARTGGRSLTTPDSVTVERRFRDIAGEVQRELHITATSLRAADGSERELRIAFGDESISVRYNPGGVVPVTIPSVRTKASTTPAAPFRGDRVSAAARWWILALCATAVAVMGAARGRDAVGRIRFRARWSRVLVRDDPAVGRLCGNEADERYAFAPGDQIITCPRCSALHHAECWQLNEGRCFTAHCLGASPSRARVPTPSNVVRNARIVGLAMLGAFVAAERSPQVVTAALETVPAWVRDNSAVAVGEAAFAFLLALLVAFPVRAFAESGHRSRSSALVTAVAYSLPTAVVASAALVAADRLFQGLGGGEMARIAAWGVFGGCLGGASLGGRLLYLLRGAAGGLVGGFVGAVVLLVLQQRWEPTLAAIPGIALVASGTALGAFGLARVLERAWLEGISGSVRGRSFPLDKYIGSRRPVADLGSDGQAIQLWAKELAPRHARVRLDGGRYVIEDLGGGVTVDGSPIRRAPLRDGSLVGLGGAQFRYRERRR